ncbi:uncharacterized protein BDR25DRAFT_395144, partial [Lindgomyces ingoldianus]
MWEPNCVDINSPNFLDSASTYVVRTAYRPLNVSNDCNVPILLLRGWNGLGAVKALPLFPTSTAEIPQASIQPQQFDRWIVASRRRHMNAQDDHLTSMDLPRRLAAGCNGPARRGVTKALQAASSRKVISRFRTSIHLWWPLTYTRCKKFYPCPDTPSNPGRVGHCGLPILQVGTSNAELPSTDEVSDHYYGSLTWLSPTARGAGAAFAVAADVSRSLTAVHSGLQVLCTTDVTSHRCTDDIKQRLTQRSEQSSTCTAGCFPQAKTDIDITTALLWYYLETSPEAERDPTRSITPGPLARVSTVTTCIRIAGELVISQSRFDDGDRSPSTSFTAPSLSCSLNGTSAETALLSRPSPRKFLLFFTPLLQHHIDFRGHILCSFSRTVSLWSQVTTSFSTLPKFAIFPQVSPPLPSSFTPAFRSRLPSRPTQLLTAIPFTTGRTYSSNGTDSGIGLELIISSSQPLDLGIAAAQFAASVLPLLPWLPTDGQMHAMYAQPAQTHGTGQYLSRGGLPVSPHMPGGDVQNLASNMGAMNLHNSYGSGSTSKSGNTYDSSSYGSLPLNQGQGLWVPNQHVMSNMYPVMPNGAPQQSAMPHSPGMYSQTGTYIPQTYQYGQAMVDHSPMAPGWASRVSSGDMPSLMTPRRDSISSNENDIPGTPYTSTGGYRYGATTAIMDRSPSAVYTNSATPSPSQLTHPYQLVGSLQKQPSMPTLSAQLMNLLQQDPAIPRAIPAPSSPLKPLDRSLENKTGETNVYIRGLLPETTDEMLHTWGKRFGDIQSSKSIIDLKSNQCKGQV